MSLRSVDFPEPLGPSRLTNEFAGTFKLMSSRARTELPAFSWKILLTLSIWIESRWVCVSVFLRHAGEATICIQLAQGSKSAGGIAIQQARDITRLDRPGTRAKEVKWQI